MGDVLREIDLDVDRTGVGSAARTRQLRAVLLAFAQRNPAVGYCQGLNFIGAMLLHVFRGGEEVRPTRSQSLLLLLSRLLLLYSLAL